MTPPTDNHYTQKSFADTFGLTYDQVKRYKKDGRLAMDGRWILGEESLNLIANTHSPKGITESIFTDTPEEQQDDTTNTGEHKLLFLEARARKEKALADKVELENRQKRGELVPMSAVVKMMGNRTRTFRDGLMLSGQRVAPVVAGMQNVKEIEDVLNTEHRYLLEQWGKEPLI